MTGAGRRRGESRQQAQTPRRGSVACLLACGSAAAACCPVRRRAGGLLGCLPMQLPAQARQRHSRQYHCCQLPAGSGEPLHLPARQQQRRRHVIDNTNVAMQAPWAARSQVHAAGLVLHQECTCRPHLLTSCVGQASPPPHLCASQLPPVTAVFFVLIVQVAQAGRTCTRPVHSADNALALRQASVSERDLPATDRGV